MRKRWTESEIKKFKKLYANNPGEKLCKIFDRGISGIYHKAKELGLKKSEAFLRGPYSGRLTGIVGSSTRFKKGTSGWNKGKKQTEYMSPESIENSTKTRFKKGNIPMNHKPIGYERKTADGYIEIKVRDSEDHTKNFELKQRWIYEQANGPIPENMIVEFADDDKNNFDIKNLLIRTRRENMLKNSVRDESIVKRFLKIKDPELVEKMIQEMPEIIELKRKNLILNRKLNESS